MQFAFQRSASKVFSPLSFKMPEGHCVLCDKWLENDAYKFWIDRDPRDRDFARCKLCSKSFNIWNILEAVLKDHMKRTKHAQLTKQRNEGGLECFVRGPGVARAASSLSAVSTSSGA